MSSGIRHPCLLVKKAIDWVLEWILGRLSRTIEFPIPNAPRLGYSVLRRIFDAR